MKRTFDIVLAVTLSVLFAVPMLLIAVVVKCTSKGPILYWSDRVGKNNTLFKMPKFRSMVFDTPTIESELLVNFDDFLTPIGKSLRYTSADELPQLFSVLKGDMSFVGYRPALPSEHYLINLRTTYGVDIFLPGLTGWAQVNGRDNISIPKKVALEVEYITAQSLLFDLRIVLLTFFKVIKGDDILR